MATDRKAIIFSETTNGCNQDWPSTLKTSNGCLDFRQNGMRLNNTKNNDTRQNDAQGPVL